MATATFLFCFNVQAKWEEEMAKEKAGGGGKNALGSGVCRVRFAAATIDQNPRW